MIIKQSARKLLQRNLLPLNLDADASILMLIPPAPSLKRLTLRGQGGLRSKFSISCVLTYFVALSF